MFARALFARDFVTGILWRLSANFRLTDTDVDVVVVAPFRVIVISGQATDFVMVSVFFPRTVYVLTLSIIQFIENACVSH